LFAVRRKGPLRHQMLYFALIVCGDPLEPTDGDRFLFHTAAATGGFARTVARPAQNAGKNVGVPIDHIGLGVAALGDQSYVLGYGCMCRAGVLAIDYLMEVFGIVNIGRFQLGHLPYLLYRYAPVWAVQVAI